MGGRSLRTMLGAGLLTIVGSMTPFLLATQAVLLQNDLGFGAAGLGMAVSIFFASAAIATFGAGHLLRRMSLRLGVGLSGLLVFAGGAGVAVVVESWCALAIGTAVLGAANATCQVTSNAIIATVLPAWRRGLGFGIKQASVPAAIMLAGLAVPTTTVVFGWRSTFAILAAIGIAIFIGSLSVPRLSMFVAHSANTTTLPWGPMLLCGVAVVLGSSAANFLGAYLASWAHMVGMSVQSAGILMAVGSASSVLARVLLGVVADLREGRHLNWVVWQMLLGAACLAGIGLLPQSGTVTIFGTLAFLIGWSWPGLMLFAVAKLVRSAPAQATSIVQASAFIGGASGPALLGWVVETIGFSVAWFVAAGAFLLAAFVLLFAIRGFRFWDGS